MAQHNKTALVTGTKFWGSLSRSVTKTEKGGGWLAGGTAMRGGYGLPVFRVSGKTLISEQASMYNELSAMSDVVADSALDVLLLLGMLMLGMPLGALLTHIRHKALTARIVQD